MLYYHTMVRVSNLEKSLDFYCNKLGLVKVTIPFKYSNGVSDLVAYTFKFIIASAKAVIKASATIFSLSIGIKLKRLLKANLTIDVGLAYLLIYEYFILNPLCFINTKDHTIE